MATTPLTPLHEESGAFLVERGGISVPAYFTHAVEEHLATRSAVGLFDLSSAGMLRVTGPERLRFLDGLLPTTVRERQPGFGALTLLLTPGGRIRSMMRLVVRSDDVLLLTPSISRAAVLRHLGDLVAATDVEIEDATSRHALLCVQGPQADACRAAVLGDDAPLPAFQSRCVATDAFGRVTLVRSPRAGEPGMDVLVEREHALALYRSLLADVRGRGGAPAGLQALDSLRIEAGFVAFGADVDERTTPHEAGLVKGVIDFGKGCFLGQEAVAAVEFRGAPERRIRGVAFRSQIPPVVGDRLLVGDDAVGSVTSSCFAPSLGHVVALAMLASPRVRRQTAVKTADGEIGIVTDVPFRRG